jgi:hypothetical protein
MAASKSATRWNTSNTMPPAGHLSDAQQKALRAGKGPSGRRGDPGLPLAGGCLIKKMRGIVYLFCGGAGCWWRTTCCCWTPAAAAAAACLLLRSTLPVTIARRLLGGAARGEERCMLLCGRGTVEPVLTCCCPPQPPQPDEAELALFRPSQMILDLVAADGHTLTQARDSIMHIL